MQVTRTGRFLTLATLALALACGNSVTGDNNNNNGNGNGNCTSKYGATINGGSWCALSAAGNYYAGQQQVVITGTGLIGAVGWSITLSASSITAPGTYALTSVTPLRFAVAGSSTGIGYSTTVAGSTGTITFTTLTTTHAVGTYSFSAIANTGGTGTVQVTNGSFDVILTPAN